MSCKSAEDVPSGASFLYTVHRYSRCLTLVVVSTLLGTIYFCYVFRLEYVSRYNTKEMHLKKSKWQIIGWREYEVFRKLRR